MMMSVRTEYASSYEISGSGFASANTIGFAGMEAIISLLTRPAELKPKKTSAFFMRSAKSAGPVPLANSALVSVMSASLPGKMSPLRSQRKIFSFFTPNFSYILQHAIALAPAPLTATITSSIFLF